jgi:hypothetical protein
MILAAQTSAPLAQIGLSEIVISINPVEIQQTHPEYFLPHPVRLPHRGCCDISARSTAGVFRGRAHRRHVRRNGRVQLAPTGCFCDYFPGDCLDNERRSSISRALNLATSRYIALDQLGILKYLPLSI